MADQTFCTSRFSAEKQSASSGYHQIYKTSINMKGFVVAVFFAVILAAISAQDTDESLKGSEALYLASPYGAYGAYPYAAPGAAPAAYAAAPYAAPYAAAPAPAPYPAAAYYFRR